MKVATFFLTMLFAPVVVSGANECPTFTLDIVDGATCKDARDLELSLEPTYAAVGKFIDNAGSDDNTKNNDYKITDIAVNVDDTKLAASSNRGTFNVAAGGESSGKSIIHGGHRALQFFECPDPRQDCSAAWCCIFCLNSNCGRRELRGNNKPDVCAWLSTQPQAFHGCLADATIDCTMVE
ncbi:expressed unknown protein [Seminavis robusta]|uniref:Uncharacterized protein n=1 Tax=Seminavis robusta TaxID=568900 RepID=A0A9N8EE81_9STRA|nr:expressed unknown protein [Seminavis robusta]|eukprot:Sro963_g225360.1 n/a (181) ;mRNA; r:38613-39273